MTTVGDGNARGNDRRGGKGIRAWVRARSGTLPPREGGTASGSAALPLPIAAPPRLATVRTQLARARTWAATASGDARSVSVWTATPPSLAMLAAYTAAGDWVPGERAPILEFLGKVYGYLIALPVTAVAYGALWLLARPLRLAIAVTLALALWATW